MWNQAIDGWVSGVTEGGITYYAAGFDRVGYDPDSSIVPIEMRTQGVDYFGGYDDGENVLIIPVGACLWVHLEGPSSFFDLDDHPAGKIYGIGGRVSVETPEWTEGRLVNWSNVGTWPDFDYWNGQRDRRVLHRSTHQLVGPRGRSLVLPSAGHREPRRLYARSRAEHSVIRSHSPRLLPKTSPGPALSPVQPRARRPVGTTRSSCFLARL